MEIFTSHARCSCVISFFCPPPTSGSSFSYPSFEPPPWVRYSHLTPSRQSAPSVEGVSISHCGVYRLRGCFALPHGLPLTKISFPIRFFWERCVSVNLVIRSLSSLTQPGSPTLSTSLFDLVRPPYLSQLDRLSWPLRPHIPSSSFQDFRPANDRFLTKDLARVYSHTCVSWLLHSRMEACLIGQLIPNFP